MNKETKGETNQSFQMGDSCMPYRQ